MEMLKSDEKRIRCVGNCLSYLSSVPEDQSSPVEISSSEINNHYGFQETASRGHSLLLLRCRVDYHLCHCQAHSLRREQDKKET